MPSIKIAYALLVMFALSGCGGGPADEPDRFQVSGEVKFDGQLVGDGMIYFEPTQGNTGAPGFAVIRAGKFDTAADGGKGHIGGKMKVRMAPGLAPDTVILDDNAPPPVKQFPLWEEVLDLPKEATTKSFDIPKDAEKMLQQKQIQDAA